MKIESTKDAGADVRDVLVYAPGSHGKTTAIATIPGKVLVLCADSKGSMTPLRGHDIEYGVVETILDVQKAYADLRAGGHGYDWVAIDSLSDLAEISLAEAMASNADGRAAYGDMYKQMRGLITAFRDLPIGFYATAEMDRFKDDAGRVLYGPGMPGQKLGPKSNHLFNYVFALRLFKVDGQDEPKRAMQCRLDVAYACKDRSGLLDMHEPVDIGAIVSKVNGNGSQGGAKKEKASNGKA